MRQLTYQVDETGHGLRLDQSMATQLPEVSRTRARALLALGSVFVNGKRVKVASRRVMKGQEVKVFLGQLAERKTAGRSEAPHIPIVFQSSQFVVVDKPSGVFSAPTPETDQNDLLHFLSEGLGDGPDQPFYLVHRLDRPTSGLMVVARTRAAAADLSRQVAEHSMSRRYWAFLVGDVAEPRVVEQPISGKSARTEFRPIERNSKLVWVEAELATGRTHQVRIHAEALGCPVAGDSKYGRQLQRHLRPGPPRLALHAHGLSFSDPVSKERREFASPMPADLLEFWSSQGRLPAS